MAALRRLEEAGSKPGTPWDPSCWLDEGSREYSGLNPDDADWLRGHTYARLAKGETISLVVEQAREDLRTSLSPIVLAGIARYLRALDVGEEWLEDLRDAAGRISLMDRFPDFVFDPPPTCCSPRLTCREELEQTAGRLSEPRSRECEASDAAAAQAAPGVTIPGKRLAAELEDQDGVTLSLAAILEAGPVLIAPFYTRCMNPKKCSRAITLLAQAAKALPEISTLGLTYDPTFDSAHRLHGYGQDRGFCFGPAARLVRCTKGWSELAADLELRVGFGGATVSNHARELLLIDTRMKVWRLPPDWLTQPEQIREFVIAVA